MLPFMDSLTILASVCLISGEVHFINGIWYLWCMILGLFHNFQLHKLLSNGRVSVIGEFERKGPWPSLRLVPAVAQSDHGKPQILQSR
jgi:hypothetical protein